MISNKLICSKKDGMLKGGTTLGCHPFNIHYIVSDLEGRNGQKK